MLPIVLSFTMKCSFSLLLLAAFVRSIYHSQLPLGSEDAANSYSADGPFTTKFDKRVQTILDHFHVPGVSISVVIGNETFAKGYGYAIFPDEKATPETLYYCGSTTKSFTAASILKLVEGSTNNSKPLTLKTKVQSLIRDEFVLQDPYATSHITLEDALSHRTGMPRHDNSYGWPNATLGGVVKNLRHLPMTSELREDWQYCNMMFMMVSYVIEKLTDMWLGDFFREHIWAPLGMHSTFLSLSDAQRAGKNGGPKLAVGYAWDNDTQEYMSTPYIDSPIVSGAGNTISNVLDYAKYMRAMLTMNETILSKPSYYELRTPRVIRNSNQGSAPPSIWTGPETYGLGWGMTVYRGYEAFSHSGAIKGFGTQMAYVPKLKNGVGLSLMANGDAMSGFVAGVLAFELVDEMLGIPEEDRIDFVGEFDAGFRHHLDQLRPDKARKRIYPDAPTPENSLPLPLPLKAYTGEYWNDGYQNLTLSLVDANSTSLKWITAEKVLHIDASSRLWHYTVTFEHVSGNYFLAWLQDAGGNVVETSVQPADFKVGVDGKVQGLGLSLEPSMGKELIWFDKRTSRVEH